MTAPEAGVAAARRDLLSSVHHGYVATDGEHHRLLPHVLRLAQAFVDSA